MNTRSTKNQPPTQADCRRGVVSSATVEYLGSIRNPVHDGLFLLLCDSRTRYGGWDVHGPELASEGSTSLTLDGLRAYVEEAHGDGRYEVHHDTAGGTLWISPPEEPGVHPIPAEALEHEPRLRTSPLALIDLPSGTLVLALAYPPLNMTTDGDHAGLTHGDGERLDIEFGIGTVEITREHTATGQVLALRAMPKPEESGGAVHGECEAGAGQNCQ